MLTSLNLKVILISGYIRLMTLYHGLAVQCTWLSRTYLEFGYGKLPNTGAGQTIREEGTLKLWLEPSLPYSNFFLQNSRLHKNVFKIHQVKGTHSLFTLQLHPWHNMQLRLRVRKGEAGVWHPIKCLDDNRYYPTNHPTNHQLFTD